MLLDLLWHGLSPFTLQLFDLCLALNFCFHGFDPPGFDDQFFASDLPLLQVSHFMLLGLLLEELFNQLFFALFLIQAALGLCLIDHHLAAPPVTLLDREIEHGLLLFDLVHGGGIGEVLDLTWRDALFFLHFLNGFFNVGVLLDTQFLEVLLKLVNAPHELSCSLIQLFTEAVLVGLDLTVLKVLDARDGVTATLLVDLPVLVALLHPVLHELFVLIEFSMLILTSLLIQGSQ